MKLNMRLTALMAAVCLLAVTVQANAQELSLASYNNLMERVDMLEQQAGGGACCAPAACVPCGGGVYANIESVFLTPFQTNNMAGLQGVDDTILNDTAVEIGHSWDLEHSMRYELGYLSTPSSLGWRARYWHFDQNSDTTDLDILDDEGIVAWGSVDDVSPIVGEVDVDGGTAVHAIDARVVDLEVLRQIADMTELSMGVRYANIGQRYIGDTDEGMYVTDMEFEGVGPTLSLSSRHPLGMLPLNVFGTARGSLLYGNAGFFTTEADEASLLLDNDMALAANADCQIGLEYANDVFFLRSAVEAQYWQNVGSPNPTAYFGDDLNVNADNPTRNSLGFLGFTLGGGVRF